MSHVHIALPAVDHQKLLLCLLVQSCAAYAGFVCLLLQSNVSTSLFIGCTAPAQLILVMSVTA